MLIDNPIITKVLKSMVKKLLVIVFPKFSTTERSKQKLKRKEINP